MAVAFGMVRPCGAIPPTSWALPGTPGVCFTPCKSPEGTLALTGEATGGHAIRRLPPYPSNGLREEGKSFLGQKNALENLFPSSPPSPRTHSHILRTFKDLRLWFLESATFGLDGMRAKWVSSQSYRQKGYNF